MRRSRLLGVLLCYNDADILEDAVTHLLANGHDVIAWDHGSTDETSSVLERFRPHLREVTAIPRATDFYDLYPLLSKHLLRHYIKDYDWISWPDQDEILEGPTRAETYRDAVDRVLDSPANWVEFRDFVYWQTDRDDATVVSPVKRVRHYALSNVGPRKIRAWRAAATNIRWFNHNPALGDGHRVPFNLRHYPMRSEAQMRRRILHDRAGIRRGQLNYHYEHMAADLSALRIRATDLHFDDGSGELDRSPIFDWSLVYGTPPRLPTPVAVSYDFASMRWHLAAATQRAIADLRRSAPLSPGCRRQLALWVRDLGRCPGPVFLVDMRTDDVIVVNDELSTRWTAGTADDADLAAHSGTAIERQFTNGISIGAAAAHRTIHVTVDAAAGHDVPLVALIPYGAPVPPRLHVGQAAWFRDVDCGRYVIAVRRPH